jgi:hypothetical protein
VPRPGDSDEGDLAVLELAGMFELVREARVERRNDGAVRPGGGRKGDIDARAVGAERSLGGVDAHAGDPHVVLDLGGCQLPKRRDLTSEPPDVAVQEGDVTGVVLVRSVVGEGKRAVRERPLRQDRLERRDGHKGVGGDGEPGKGEGIGAHGHTSCGRIDLWRDARSVRR